jgi:staphylococcal nuclease domain-containing protein 1
MQQQQQQQPLPQAAPGMQKGIVKCVLSGDTIVIRGRPVNGPPPEKILGLAYLSAPKLLKSECEPFAFHAREFLRKLLVGHDVQFHREYTNQSGKEYASIFFVSGDGDRKNVAELLVEEGWARVRNEDSVPGLKALEEKARQEQKGIWADDSKGNVQVNLCLNFYFEISICAILCREI